MILVVLLFCTFMSGFFMLLGFMPVKWESRPTLQTLGLTSSGPGSSKKKTTIFSYLRKFSFINKPICVGTVRKVLAKDLVTGRLNLSPEEFYLVQELILAAVLLITYPYLKSDLMSWMFIGGFMGIVAPRFWLKGRIKKVKNIIVKELPDAIDLLGLCVNAGLDFMLSLKWVVDKSQPSIMIDELNVVLQEINVGKTRRDAIKDLAARYELPDLSTFARTLIQADKMGTSVTDALNILSEDMRIARYRRGEQLALKAPLKMLVPLLVFIFPVVGILVAGPIVLDFVENNPFAQMGGGGR